jgi:nucleoside-diphosphate-sugar epimerase
MAHSFTATEPGALAQIEEKRRKVLVTGAAGRIGSYFAQNSGKKYDLVLTDHELDKMKEAGHEELGELIELDITDLEAFKKRAWA